MNGYTATVTVTVNGVNDVPVAVDDFAITDEDTLLTGNVLTNESISSESSSSKSRKFVEQPIFILGCGGSLLCPDPRGDRPLGLA